jgi:hypothetical protein
LATLALGIARGKDFPVIKDFSHVLSEDGAWLVVEREYPLTLIHPSNKEELKKYSYSSDDIHGSIYMANYNVIVFENEEHFLHEAAHATMNILFNNEANPYPEEKGEIFKAYENAEKDVLIKILNRLGIETDETIQYQSVHQLKYTLETNSSFKSLFSDENHEEIPNLNITKSEYDLFFKIFKLFNAYNQENFDQELIVILHELAFDGADSETLHHYFGKMEEFWTDHVHSRVVPLIEQHQNFCNAGEPHFIGNNSSLSFEYCVSEFLN